LDAQHLLWFGMDLSSPHIPTVELGLHSSIRHILGRVEEGRFPTVLKSLVPTLLCMPRAALWHEDVLQLEGLFPCRTPMAKVYCPSHRLKDRWTVHELTIQEKLQLFQMPLAMDPLLLGFNPSIHLQICCPQRCTTQFFASCGVLIGGGSRVWISFWGSSRPLPSSLKWTWGS
jgi:hypothetical protein